MKRSKYLPFDLLSCTIWAVLMGSLGYAFGASLEALLGQVKHYEKFVVLFIVAVGLTGWLVRRLWSRRQRRRAIKSEERSRCQGSEHPNADDTVR